LVVVVVAPSVVVVAAAAAITVIYSNDCWLPENIKYFFTSLIRSFGPFRYKIDVRSVPNLLDIL
jgi:hypothetical protein